MKAKILATIIVVSIACWATSAAAVDTGLRVSGGYSSSEEVTYFRGAFAVAPERKWFEEGAWYLGMRFDLAFIYLNSESDVVNIDDDPDSLQAIAITPVFRLQRVPYANTVSPYFEAAVGASFFSEDTLQNDQPAGLDFGGTFQFEDIISVGMAFGERQQFELSASYTHYSNLSFYDENDGIDIFSATFGMWF